MMFSCSADDVHWTREVMLGSKIYDYDHGWNWPLKMETTVKRRITEVTVTRFSPQNSRVEQFPNGFHVSDDMLFCEFS